MVVYRAKKSSSIGMGFYPPFQTPYVMIYILSILSFPIEELFFARCTCTQNKMFIIYDFPTGVDSSEPFLLDGVIHFDINERVYDGLVSIFEACGRLVFRDEVHFDEVFQGRNTLILDEVRQMSEHTIKGVRKIEPRQ
jgi:hypothetical protein